MCLVNRVTSIGHLGFCFYEFAMFRTSMKNTVFAMLNPLFIPTAREQHIIIKDACSYFSLHLGFYNVEDVDSAQNHMWLRWKIDNLPDDYCGLVFYTIRQFDWTIPTIYQFTENMLIKGLCLVFAAERVILKTPADLNSILFLNFATLGAVANRNHLNSDYFFGANIAELTCPLPSVPT
jgi:hypothetical protein